MNKYIKYTKELLKMVETANRFAPFPVYDSEFVVNLKKQLNIMENSKIDYDSIPVTACRFCKELYIIVDDLENNVCLKCGSVNETKTFATIHEYLKFKNKEEGEDN